MAKLTELCSNIPDTLMREQVMRELIRRKARSYTRRVDGLKHEAHVFSKCAQRRPVKGKVKNTASSEEAGTIGKIVVGIRTGKYSVVVCKSRKRD